MNGFRTLLSKLFGGGRREPAVRQRPDLAPLPSQLNGERRTDDPAAIYRKGDFIGKSYEVFGVLGVGGFSVVYLVYSHENDTAYALKTLRDQFLLDPETREQFRREAKVWVDLERHPYVVSAHFIEELAGRLYIGMEYVAPNEDGLNSLEGYIHHSPPDLVRSLAWAIQFSHGMEYANSRGIRSHRDIKPANIMITQDRIVKITDFGFADLIERTKALDGIRRRRRSVPENIGFGTPNFMPPEQFLNAAHCDARSDIYSFGIVLYQLASGGQLPFTPPLPSRTGRKTSHNVWREMHRLHAHAPVPPLPSPLFPIIQKCMQKEQSARYQTFRDLRRDLEALLRRHGAEVVVPEHTRALEAWEIYNKAFSLASLGQLEDAIKYYDRVLELEPGNSEAWNNRGVCCKKLGRLEDALTGYENAIKAERHNASAWSNKGNVLYALGRYPEAIVSLNKAIDIDPLNESAWLNKGIVEERLGLRREAASSFKRFIDLEPVAYAAHLDYARKRLADLQAQQ